MFDMWDQQLQDIHQNDKLYEELPDMKTTEQFISDIEG